jgi:predicted nucleic acid-binding protein
MTALMLDTDVAVDILRGFEPALRWLESLPEAPKLPGFVVMELMAGCRNREEMNQLLKSVHPFRVCWPTQDDCNRALTDFANGSLSHNLGILDAVIGECAVGLGAGLCTFNVKHYRAIQELDTVQPYPRLV